MIKVVEITKEQANSMRVKYLLSQGYSNEEIMEKMSLTKCDIYEIKRRGYKPACTHSYNEDAKLFPACKELLFKGLSIPQIAFKLEMSEYKVRLIICRSMDYEEIVKYDKTDALHNRIMEDANKGLTIKQIVKKHRVREIYIRSLCREHNVKVYNEKDLDTFNRHCRVYSLLILEYSKNQIKDLLGVNYKTVDRVEHRIYRENFKPTYPNTLEFKIVSMLSKNYSIETIAKKLALPEETVEVLMKHPVIKTKVDKLQDDTYSGKIHYA